MKLKFDNDIENKILCKFFSNKNNKIRLNTNYTRMLNNEFGEYLNSLYDDSLSIKETLWRLYYKIDNHPKCKYCGELAEFNLHAESKFLERCSNKKCKNKYVAEKSSAGFLEKYGVKNPSQLSTWKERVKNTKLIKYGDENYNNSSKMKKTKFDKYGSSSFVNPQKCKQTKLERYGDENYNNSSKISESLKETILNNKEIIVRKRKNTNLIKYNNENYINIEQQQKTNLLKYGNVCSLHGKEQQKKVKETMINKYGGDCVMHIPYFIDKISNSEQRKQHEYETKKKNGSFNSSQPEKETFELLKSKFSDTISQYRDERYPFNCDFYIPSLDLFIECQYSWTHGGHPYNKENDKEKLELWESKNTQYYKNAITTWTIRDVKKREIAKQNNLNFLEFFTIIDLKNWLNTYGKEIY